MVIFLLTRVILHCDLHVPLRINIIKKKERLTVCQEQGYANIAKEKRNDQRPRHFTPSRRIGAARQRAPCRHR